MRYEGGDRSFAEAIGGVMHHALQLPDATLFRLGHRRNLVYSVYFVKTILAIRYPVSAVIAAMSRSTWAGETK